MNGILKKWWFWLIIIVVVVVAVMMFKKTSASNGDASVLGTTKSGKPYTEADVQKEMKIIQGINDWYEKVKTGATEKGISVSEALRANAIWMLENAAGH